MRLDLQKGFDFGEKISAISWLFHTNQSEAYQKMDDCFRDQMIEPVVYYRKRF